MQSGFTIFKETRRPPLPGHCESLNRSPSPGPETWHSRPRTETNPSQQALVSFSNALAWESYGLRRSLARVFEGRQKGKKGLKGLAPTLASPNPKITYKENPRTARTDRGAPPPALGKSPCSSSLKLFV